MGSVMRIRQVGSREMSVKSAEAVSTHLTDMKSLWLMIVLLVDRRNRGFPLSRYHPS